MPRIERDGVALVYDDVGSGAGTFVFVHGAYANRSAFDEQVRAFASSHRIVTFDMRGHGESDKPPGPYSMDDWAEDVRFLCSQLGVTRPIIVGHSMGGLVSVEVAARDPELVRAVVTLDSPSMIPGWSSRYPGSYSAAMTEPGFRDTLKEFLGVAWHPVDDPQRQARAMAMVDAMPDHAILSTWGALREWDPVPALRGCAVPYLYIDHGQPDVDIEVIRSYCPQVVSAQTVGAGHWALQEVPDQVNGMLRRFDDHAEELAAVARETHGAFTYRS